MLFALPRFASRVRWSRSSGQPAETPPEKTNPFLRDPLEANRTRLKTPDAFWHSDRHRKGTAGPRGRTPDSVASGRLDFGRRQQLHWLYV
jgi:hypothetical protein